MKLTKKKYYVQNLDDLNKGFDAFVCGSDQIWNPKSIKCDGTYFLDFVADEEKRISYAPSVGVNEFDLNNIKIESDCNVYDAIDYECLKSKIKRRKEQSLEYLKQSISFE